MATRRSQGSLRPHGAGWQLRYKGICRQVRGSRREAEKELAAFVTAVEAGSEVLVGRGTFGDYLTEQWLPYKAQTLRSRVARRYEELIRIYVVPQIGSIRLSKVRPVHVQRVLSRMTDSGCSPATVRQCRSVMSSAFGRAIRWQLVSTNPVLAIEAPRLERPKLIVPSPEEVKRLREASMGGSLEGPVVIAAATGMRLGEVLGMRWSDVDLEHGRVHVTSAIQWTGGDYEFVPPKTKGSRRAVVLPECALEWLRKHRKKQSARRLSWGEAWRGVDVVLERGDGYPLRSDTVSKSFAKLARDVGCDGVRFHDLRHAYATALLQAAVHPKVVSEALGHSSVAFTMEVYQHVLHTMQEHAAHAVNEAFGW